MLNVFFLVQWNRPHQQAVVKQNTEPVSIESFAKAYNLDTETVYE